jgi:hypothetical protein
MQSAERSKGLYVYGGIEGQHVAGGVDGLGFLSADLSRSVTMAVWDMAEAYPRARYSFLTKFVPKYMAAALSGEQVV